MPKEIIQLSIDRDVKDYIKSHISNISREVNEYFRRKLEATDTREVIQAQKKEVEKYLMDLDNKLKMLESIESIEQKKIADAQDKQMMYAQMEHTQYEKWILSCLTLEEIKTFDIKDKEKYTELYKAIRDKHKVKPLLLKAHLEIMKNELG